MFKKKTLTKQDILLLKEKYPENFLKQVKKVENGYPVQYLIGEVAFLNTNILVNEDVLIPRFETEYLVEKILKKMMNLTKKPLKVLDIGTGSGCISIALSKNTSWICKGIDISKKALEIAKNNNKINNTTVSFEQQDILKKEIKDTYDIIVSNPPYIAKNDIVDPTVLYEPSIALFAEEEGLQFYKNIISKITKNPLLIAFEIGENEGEYLLSLFKKAFPFSKVSLEKDLCGKDRYIFIEKNK